ncbi:Extracellular dioxygenase [Mycena chlorophos]|uniref:Extracellular dioxygenase n=1 Tax=Mycena chlorophos TaxID=658473 RepID=A0A8H6SU01_MYCCL|nr:Extracellular dioxygenase [Mycena chlorophos]
MGNVEQRLHPERGNPLGDPSTQPTLPVFSGVELIVDIGVMDITTCKPYTNAMVELWGANAVGEYLPSSLRGAVVTGSNGIAEFTTIYPGVTAGSVNHLNILVHENAAESSNIVHIGQLFFYDSWNHFVGIYTIYDENPNPYLYNADDPNYAAASKGGFYPVINTLSIEDDWPEGIIGDITVGIIPSKVATV